jgi:hypothetical protein
MKSLSNGALSAAARDQSGLRELREDLADGRPTDSEAGAEHVLRRKRLAMLEFGNEIQSIVERFFEHRVRFHSSTSKELSPVFNP